MRIDHSAAIAIGVLALSFPSAAHAQDSTLVCHASPCAVTFEWGNNNEIPDIDRRYGAPADLEAAFLARLDELGFKTARGGDAPVQLVVRLTPLNRAICDALSGTNTDYSCHTVDRATIIVRQAEASAKQIPRVDLLARCSDPKVSASFAQFGRYSAEMFAYTVGGAKGSRPSVKCG